MAEILGNNTNKWLILSYCSNADGRAAALHIDNRLAYMEQLGIQPVMLSGPNFPRHKEIVHARAFSLAPSGIWFEFRTFLNRYVKYRKLRNFLKFICLLPLIPFYLLEKAIINIESQWSWFPAAALRGRLLNRKHGFNIIYSTGGSICAHLAAALLARWSGLPWIAEFQDPLVHDDWHRSRRSLKIYGAIEQFICARAQAVVFLTDKARQRSKERTLLGEKGKVVYPGAIPSAAGIGCYTRSEQCRFVHLGSLGETRNLKVFLEALRLYFEENPSMIPFVRLDLYGTCDQLSKELVAKFPYGDLVTDFGRVSHKESLAAMKQADILLLIQDREEFSKETIPSKSYEYLLSNRPILGLIYRNQELHQMLTDLGHRSVDANCVEGVKEGLTAMIEQWRCDKFNLKPSPYTVSEAVSEIVKIAGKMVEHKKFAVEECNAG